MLVVAYYLLSTFLSSEGWGVSFSSIVLAIFFTFMVAGVATIFLSVFSTGAMWLLWPSYRRMMQYDSGIENYKQWWNRTQSAHWTSLDGKSFEIELANLLRRRGYSARRTPYSGDKGVDIWLQGKNGRIAVQCKAHKRPVGPGAARELYGTLQHFNAQGAILASVSGFSKGVYEYARGKPIELLDLAGILAMQRETKQ